MRKFAVTLGALLLIPLLSTSFSVPDVQGKTIDSSVASSWKLDAKPLDMVHSLDNKRVFILGDDHQVHVYSADGNKQGAIPVDKGVTSIDIAPRGEFLYLVNQQDNTFTSLTVSFTAKIDIAGSPFLGEPDAPVVLAVFSDFQ